MQVTTKHIKKFYNNNPYVLARILRGVIMARRNTGIGNWIVGFFIFIGVFWVLYEHFVDPYTPPQKILLQYIDGLWAQFIGTLISTVGFTVTILFISVIVAGAYINSKSKR